jgi:hypothetical protein
MKRDARTPIEDRFWAMVQKGYACWTWTGCIDQRGYGQIARGGKYGGHVKTHRLAYEIQNGLIAPGLHVLHRCDNPSCVRGDHLFLGTHTDNMRDMWSKGRGRCEGAGRRGQANANHRLTEEQAAEILVRHQRGEPSRALGAEFGVSKTLVLLISKGRVWQHLQGSNA